MTGNTDRADRGETLVEILVAVSILGVAIVTLISALATNVVATVVNRGQAKAETTLLAASEYVKSLAFTSAQFSCTGGSPTTVTTAQVPHDTTFTVTYGPPVAIGSTSCGTIVRVPVTVTGDGFTLSMDVVKRA